MRAVRDVGGRSGRASCRPRRRPRRARRSARSSSTPDACARSGNHPTPDALFRASRRWSARERRDVVPADLARRPAEARAIGSHIAMTTGERTSGSALPTMGLAVAPFAPVQASVSRGSTKLDAGDNTCGFSVPATMRIDRLDRPHERHLDVNGPPVVGLGTRPVELRRSLRPPSPFSRSRRRRRVRPRQGLPRVPRSPRAPDSRAERRAVGGGRWRRGRRASASQHADQRHRTRGLRTTARSWTEENRPCVPGRPREL